MNNRYTDKYEFDRFVANYYVNKISSSKGRGIEFNLTLTQVRNMLRAKYCQLTGIPLSHYGAGQVQASRRLTDVTIDRIDCNRPYETGNVIAVAHFVNSVKSQFEAVERHSTVNMIHKMSSNLKRLGYK